jgi:putative chitinase
MLWPGHATPVDFKMTGEAMLTVDQFTKLFPHNKQPADWTAAINLICPQYGIDTPQRLAMFLAQCGHESKGFTSLRENLNYSAEGLLRMWPRRFTSALAQAYEHQPEAIANFVYADRLGNGNEASGDGWRFRGYGPIQLTGAEARKAFAKAINKTLEEAEAYILTHEGGIESACWFWTTRNLNKVADAADVSGCTKRITGGVTGLPERKTLYASTTAVLAVG